MFKILDRIIFFLIVFVGVYSLYDLWNLNDKSKQEEIEPLKITYEKFIEEFDSLDQAFQLKNKECKASSFNGGIEREFDFDECKVFIKTKDNYIVFVDILNDGDVNTFSYITKLATKALSSDKQDEYVDYNIDCIITDSLTKNKSYNSFECEGKEVKLINFASVVSFEIEVLQ